MPTGDQIGPDGGTVATPGFTLEVPAGALTTPTAITATTTSIADLGIPASFGPIPGTGFSLTPEGLTFAQPVTIRITYDPTALPAGVSADELQVLHVGATVEPLASTVDPTNHRVEATATHFSGFALGVSVGRYQRIACPGLAPAAIHGVPLDRVAIGTLPSIFSGPLVVAVALPGDTVTSYGLLDTNTDGTRSLVVPIHPSTQPSGGAVQLQVTDGTHACAPFDFTIDPLPAAPGELLAITNALQSIVSAQEAVFGLTPAELNAIPPDQLTPDIIPLALMQSVLDGPGSPHSLRAIATGATSDAAGARLDLVEPLLARTGARQLLEHTVAGLRSGRAVRQGGGIAAGLCVPHVVNSDPGLLDGCMQSQADAAFRLQGATGKVLNDMGFVAGEAGMVPGLGTAASLTGFATWLLLNADGRAAAMLPSELFGMTAEVDPGSFLEDEDRVGHWRVASVSARSIGYDYGRELLEGLLQASGAAGAFDTTQIGGPSVNKVLAYLLTGPVATELAKRGAIDQFNIPPAVFGPVSVQDQQWSEDNLVGNAVALTAHARYEPRHAGTATLSVKTKAGRFGGHQAHWEHDLTVGQLTVSVTPTEVFLQPDAVQDFTVVVHDAAHPGAVAVQNPGTLQGMVTSPEYDGVLQTSVVSYTAPHTPNAASPDLIAIEDTATTGARGYATDARTAVATVRFGRIDITPGSACLPPDSTLQMSAAVQGLQDQSVTWSADVGTIDPVSGLYRAPSTAPAGGVAIITAQSATHPALTAQVAINIGSCSCNWSGLLEGRSITSDSGDAASFLINPGDRLATITFVDDETGATLSFTVSIPGEAGVPVGQLGDVPVYPYGTLGVAPGDLLVTAAEAGPATMTLTRNDGTVVEGTVAGMGSFVTPSNTGSPRQGAVQASFRIVSDGAPVVLGVPPYQQITYACTVGGP